MLLLSVLFAWWGAWVAFALLLVFTIAIGASMASGLPLLWATSFKTDTVGTLLRTELLMGVAGFLVFEGRESPGMSLTGWAQDLYPSEVVGMTVAFVIFLLVAGESWLLIELIRQNGRILLRLDALETRMSGNITPESPRPQPQVGLPVGSWAPEFELTL